MDFRRVFRLLAWSGVFLPLIFRGQLVTEVEVKSGPSTAKIDITHKAYVPPLVASPDWAFITLPAGLQPLQVSQNGVVLLSDNNFFYRWQNGVLETLHPRFSSNSTWVNPQNERTYKANTASNTAMMNSMGDIAINYYFSASWKVAGSSDTYYDAIYSLKKWKLGSTTPEVIDVPRFDFTTLSFFHTRIGHISENIAVLKGLDDTGSIWAQIGDSVATVEDYYGLLDQRLLSKIVRIDPAGESSPTPFQQEWVSTSFQLDGISGSGVSIGSVTQGSVYKYYVDNIEVNFRPVFINKNNWLLGFTLNGNLRFVQEPDGTRPPIPADGFVTWIDDQNRLNGVYFPDPNSATAVNAVWMRNATDPLTYVRKDYVHLQPPPPWSTNHEVAPGSTSIQLGLMTRPTDTGSETRSFLAMPAAIAVDANRDSVIKLASEDASDATTSANPYRFWLNDDDDELVDSSQTGLYTEFEQDDRDVSVTQQADWTDNQLSPNGTRDLEDFTRLWIDLSALKDQIHTGDIRIGLKWTDVSEGAPAIKLFRTNDTYGTGSLKYLTDPGAADHQIGAHAIYDVTRSGSDHTLIEGTGTLILGNFEFSKDQLPHGKAYWLLEGCKAGKGQLRVVLLDKNRVEIGIGPGVWLDLKEPKEFVERWSCGDDPLGTVQSVVRVNSKSVSPAWGSPAIDEERDYVLYVHGYNMQEFEKQRWLETAAKRLWHLGYKGRVGSFTWPCSDSALPYDQSEERAWQSAAQLRALLSSLKTAGYHVHVLGHSQGNVVVGEALRQRKEAGNTDALVRTYVASQAAIQAHCYDPDAALIPDFAGSFTDDGTPNVYANYTPTGAPYLSAAAMGGAAARFLNFENLRDYALTGNSLDLLNFHPGWQANQRLKPDLGYSYDSGGGFKASTSVGLSIPLGLPADRFRIFSYCAEGRSLALGSTPTGGVFANTNIDLSLAPFSYGQEHLFHSGQFRSSMAERYQYWRALMQAADLTPN